MFNKKLLVLATGAALLAGAQSGFAAGNLGAGAIGYDITLADSCTSVTASGMSFGTFVTSAPSLSGVPAGQVDVLCPTGLPYVIMVDGGIFSNGFQRQMNNGGPDFMTYDLIDGALGVVVGDANPAAGSGYGPVYSFAPWANGISGTGNNTVISHMLLANVNISTALMVAGTYTDAVGVTVTW